MAKSKRKCEIIHVKNRFIERYNVFFTKEDIEKISQKCKQAKYLYHFGKISLSKSMMLMEYKDIVFPVVYDKNRHSIVTVLTVDMLTKDEQEQINDFI